MLTQCIMDLSSCVLGFFCRYGKDTKQMKTFSGTEQSKPNILLHTELEFHVIITLSTKSIFLLLPGSIGFLSLTEDCWIAVVTPAGIASNHKSIIFSAHFLLSGSQYIYVLTYMSIYVCTIKSSNTPFILSSQRYTFF